MHTCGSGSHFSTNTSSCRSERLSKFSPTIKHLVIFRQSCEGMCLKNIHTKTILVSSKPNLVIANRYCHLLFHANTMIRSQSMSIYDYRPTSMGEMHSFNRRLRRKYGSVIGWKNLETLEFRSQYTTSTFTKSVCSFDITTDDSHVKRDLYTTQDTEQRLFPCK